MATETATIRVNRETRDVLASISRGRGVSLAALLAEIARDLEREEMFRSEREATLADGRSPEAMEEYRLWESTLEDGID